VSKSIVMATATSVELSDSSVPAEWVISGTPKAWVREVSRTRDRNSQVVVWECTAGHFTWHYSKDESVVVLSGEAFLIQPDGNEIRFGAGDVGFFPAGVTCEWRVPGPFRKVAVMREPLWKPLGYAMKAWNRIAQIIGLQNGAPKITLDHSNLSSSQSASAQLISR